MDGLATDTLPLSDQDDWLWNMSDDRYEGERLDERTSMVVELRELRREVREIKGALESKYVTKEAFAPVKLIAYGLVTLLLTAVIIAIVRTVVK